MNLGGELGAGAAPSEAGLLCVLGLLACSLLVFGAKMARLGVLSVAREVSLVKSKEKLYNDFFFYQLRRDKQPRQLKE